MIVRQTYNPIPVTLPEIYPNEPEAFAALLAAGTEIIHVRKPGADLPALGQLLARCRERGIESLLTLHHHPDLASAHGVGGWHIRAEEMDATPNKMRLSSPCHSWNEVLSTPRRVDYVLLSPVFDSVSKQGYTSAFSPTDLKVWLSTPDRPAVIALGGITPGNIDRVRSYGFEGAAAIGSLWVIKDNRIDIEPTVANYRKLLQAWKEAK